METTPAKTISRPLTPEVRNEIKFILDGLTAEMIDESLGEAIYLIRELVSAEQYWREKYMLRTSLEIVSNA